MPRYNDDTTNQAIFHKWSKGGQSRLYPVYHPTGTSFVKDDIRQGDFKTPLPYAASFATSGKCDGLLRWRRSYKYSTQPEVIDEWETPLPYYNLSFPALPSADNMAKAIGGVVSTRLLSKSVSASNNIVLAYADRKRTAALAKSLVQQVYSMSVSFARRDWRALGDQVLGNKNSSGRRPNGGSGVSQILAQSVANRHLAFIYGIMPVINEVNGLLELNGRPLDCVVRARESTSDTISQVILKHRKNTGLNDRREDYVPAVCQKDTTRTVSARGKLRFRIRSGAVDYAGQLGVLSPRYAMYDQVALSFVLAWFSNISSYLIALDSGLVVEPQGYHVTTRVHDTSQFLATPLYPNGFDELVNSRYRVYHTFSGKSSYVATATAYKRTVGVVPEASLHLVDNFTTFAGLAGLSLVVQRYASRVRALQERSPSSTNPRFRFRPIRVRTLKSISYRKP